MEAFWDQEGEGTRYVSCYEGTGTTPEQSQPIAQGYQAYPFCLRVEIPNHQVHSLYRTTVSSPTACVSERSEDQKGGDRESNVVYSVNSVGRQTLGCILGLHTDCHRNGPRRPVTHLRLSEKVSVEYGPVDILHILIDFLMNPRERCVSIRLK